MYFAVSLTGNGILEVEAGEVGVRLAVLAEHWWLMEGVGAGVRIPSCHYSVGREEVAD
jgi:hypothetical protein